MAKHKRQSSANLDSPPPSASSKKIKTGNMGNDRTQSGVQGRIDPTFGQRSAIPGLDDDVEMSSGDDTSEKVANIPNGSYEIMSVDVEAVDAGGLNEEDQVSKDAFKYLRAVRLEALGIPTLLVAPRSEEWRDTYERGTGDSRGYYRDGAYTAVATDDAAIATAQDGGDLSDPQNAYFDGILARYSALRSQLASTPPRVVIERLSKDHVTYMGGNEKDWKAWRWRLKNVDLAPAQMACMDKGSVLRLLRLVTRELGANGAQNNSKMLSKRLSIWIWGLLARLPDRGELNSEEVGVVRELGKRAVWLSVKIKGVHDLSLLSYGVAEDSHEAEQIDEEVPLDTVVEDNEHANEVESGDEDLEAAKARMISHLRSSSPKDATPEDPEIPKEMEVKPASDQPAEDCDDDLLHNTKVTIDMLITVVGEVYGQRDLLEFRDAWE